MNLSQTDQRGSHPQAPAIFEEFFELGLQESVSPFIQESSRHWGINLTLKASLLSAFLLLIAFILSFSVETHPISNILVVSVYFLAGIPALIESLEDLATFEINIDILMTLAAFSSVLIGSSMEGALLLVLFALSGSMEDAVTAKAKGSISSLHKLSPTKACVIEKEGILLERSIKDIFVGTIILVKSGQVVPLDGEVVDGISSVNLVHLTGENFPVTKTVGDEVPAGARNLEGALTLRVTRTSADSTLARIIQLVTNAQEARPKLQRWFDLLSKGYAISIILLAGFFALTFPWIFSIPFFGPEGSIYRSLAFLIAASPCALIIAIPIAYLSAVSACAKKGILLKGGITLDALASCQSIAFDKTGTLTTGDLTCHSIKPLESDLKISLKMALAVAYALEKNAVHPIAKAILKLAEEQKVISIPLKDFKAIPGMGLQAVALFPEGNQNVSIGKPEFITSQLPPHLSQSLMAEVQKLQANGELIAILLIDQHPFIFRLTDTLRPKIKETVSALRTNQKLKVVMLTGDHQESAQRIASEMSIDNFHADLKPEDKLDHITKIAALEHLAMVGDGVNDAPALARASVGICMGKVGSTAAIDAADVILLNDNIELLDWLFSKSHKTVAIVRENLALAALAILIATVPALAGWIPLWLAVVLHEGGTVLVGLNGLRLLRS